jgi:hypothetical protein
MSNVTRPFYLGEQYNKKEDALRFSTIAANFLAMKEYAHKSGRQLVLNEYADCTKEELWSVSISNLYYININFVIVVVITTTTNQTRSKRNGWQRICPSLGRGAGGGNTSDYVVQ